MENMAEHDFQPFSNNNLKSISTRDVTSANGIFRVMEIVGSLPGLGI
jgi:hypothetical protein